LVHNSSAFAEVGYYYPEFDINIGQSQLAAAINDKKYDENRMSSSFINIQFIIVLIKRAILSL
jgi:hypothetical protein